MLSTFKNCKSFELLYISIFRNKAKMQILNGSKKNRISIDTTLLYKHTNFHSIYNAIAKITIKTIFNEYLFLLLCFKLFSSANNFPTYIHTNAMGKLKTGLVK